MKSYAITCPNATFENDLIKSNNDYTNINTQALLNNTFEYYKNEGRALITPHQSNCSAKEYIGVIKSGKAIYFAFVDNLSEGNTLQLDFFITKAKKVFSLGGIVFVLLYNYEKAYRIPYFVLELFKGQAIPDKSIINPFEIKSTKKIIDFLQKDIFECTVVGEKTYQATR